MADELRKADARRLYWRLLRHVSPYRATFALSVLAMVIVATTEPILPAMLKPIVDGSFVENNIGEVNTLILLLLVVMLVRGFAAYGSTVGFAWISGKLVTDLQTQMFEKLVRLPSTYYDHHSAGNIISRFVFDVSQVTRAATQVLTVLVRDTLAITGLICWMLYLDWRLAMIALTVAPVIALIVKKIALRLRRVSRNVQRHMGNITHVLEESIGGHQVVRIFRGERHEQERFGAAIEAVRRFRLKFASADALGAPAGHFVATVALAIIIYTAARQSAAGELTVGSFVSFFAAMGMIFGPLKRLTKINAPLQQGLAAAESVFHFLDEPAEHDKGTQVLQRAEGHLEFRDVWFTYESRRQPALSGISLAIRSGETVALVGASGSGKSTLAQLIPRLYDTTQGEILLDGINIESITLSSLRSHISVVSQDVVLFNDTLAANIAYGPLRETDESAVIDAAKAAHLWEFVETLPDGLNTLVGDNGIRLSGGQRQRLSIARAFLKDTPILILDEATSSLDSASERHIQTSLQQLRQGRTTLVIAHRLSTIENADRIAVIAAGRLVEYGNHAALLQKNGFYARLYQVQFARQLAGQSTPHS
jgi:subfamily B ATP-binding cassette protein MsbA